MAGGDTLIELTKRSAERFGEKTAVLSLEEGEYRKYSYRSLYSSILKAASYFREKGIGKGAHAALLMQNRVEWMISYFGLIHSGAVCVPLNPMLGAEELLGILEESNSSQIVLTKSIFEDKFSGKDKELPEKLLFGEKDDDNVGDMFSVIKNMSELRQEEEVSSEDVASLIYTSGTTADPKGVLLTHRNICSNFESVNKLKFFSREDNILALLPLYHTYPFMVTLILPFFSGVCVTYYPVSFRQDMLRKVIKEASVTILAAVPRLYEVIREGIYKRIKWVPEILRPFAIPFLRYGVRKAFGSELRLMVSGGARLDHDTAKDISHLGFNIVEGYGLTETAPIVSFNPPEALKFGSVGKPVPEVKVKIKEPDENGTGEVCVKGPNVMKGYYKMPGETEKALEKGWFHTGDLGYMDSEGYLFLTGRKKEVIVLGSGKNIYPQEVEKHYSQSPYIKEICVFPAKKKKGGGEFLKALIVPDVEYLKQRGEKNAEEKVRWSMGELAGELPEYKRVHGFTLTSRSLPRTSLGKLQRYKIRDEYHEKEKPGDKRRKKLLPEDDEDISDKKKARRIMDLLNSELDEDVGFNDHLEIDLGVDSLQKVQLGMALEELFNRQIPDKVMYESGTVKELVIRVNELIEKKPEGEQASRKKEDWEKILGQEPSEESRRNIQLSPGPVNFFFTKLFVFFFRRLFRTGWDLRVYGKENLPEEGPYFICPNHVSYLDAFIVEACLTPNIARNVYYLGYREILEKPAFRWGRRWGRLVSIDPGGDFVETMRIVSYLMKKDKIVCFFPEGNRSYDGTMQKFKKGAGIMIKNVDAPVVPVHIKGAFEAWPWGRAFPRFHPIEIRFGKALEWKAIIKENGEGDDYTNISEGLRDKVKELGEGRS
jgi:long-chain acyl-CoA synthetase